MVYQHLTETTNNSSAKATMTTETKPKPRSHKKRREGPRGTLRNRSPPQVKLVRKGLSTARGTGGKKGWWAETNVRSFCSHKIIGRHTPESAGNQRQDRATDPRTKRSEFNTGGSKNRKRIGAEQIQSVRGPGVTRDTVFSHLSRPDEHRSRRRRVP